MNLLGRNDFGPSGSVRTRIVLSGERCLQQGGKLGVRQTGYACTLVLVLVS